MRRQPIAVRGVSVVSFALVLVACSGNRPVELPPQSLDETASRNFGERLEEAKALEEAGDERAGAAEENSMNDEESEVVSVDEVAAAAPDRPQPKRDGSVVVIGAEGENDAKAANPLMAASAAERRRRQTAPAAVAVINDKNLAEFAEGGKLTIVEAPPAGTDDAPDAGAALAADEELYWRTRVRALRAEWRHSADLIVELEEQAEGLRRQFYAEDDPYVRDRRIKPEWDRVLDRLDEARRAVERSREELATALEEGRQAGALPGWLRDGAGLEPEPATQEETRELDPEEPRVIDP